MTRACYIAGPMRGKPEYNYPEFFAAQEALETRGWKVYNPAAMDVEKDDEDYTARTIEEQKLHDTASAARRFARRDTDVILRKLYAERGDAIVVLPGWEDSTGAVAEVACGEWVQLKILTIEEVLNND